MRDPATRTPARQHERRDPRPAYPGASGYLAQAEACLSAALAASDAGARALHQEECRLWLILAEQRRAIDAMLKRYRLEADGA